MSINLIFELNDSEKLSIYTQCTTVFARPIRFCLRCHDQYINVLQAYNAMENYKQVKIKVALCPGVQFLFPLIYL